MQRAALSVLALLAAAGTVRATPEPAATPPPGGDAAVAEPAATPSTHPATPPDPSQARPAKGPPGVGEPGAQESGDQDAAPAETQAGSAPPAVPTPASPALPLPPNTARLAVSSVLGRTVAGPDRQDIGRVVDVLVDSSGQPRAAVIDFGGFMGLGSRKIAVEWDAFRFPPGGSDATLTIALSPEEIKNTPEYVAGKPVTVVGPGTPEPRPGP